MRRQQGTCISISVSAHIFNMQSNTAEHDWRFFSSIFLLLIHILASCERYIFVKFIIKWNVPMTCLLFRLLSNRLLLFKLDTNCISAIYLFVTKFLSILFLCRCSKLSVD